jgi:hypothetical protein
MDVSKSFAGLRHRPGHAKVRSTTPRQRRKPDRDLSLTVGLLGRWKLHTGTNRSGMEASDEPRRASAETKTAKRTDTA